MAGGCLWMVKNRGDLVKNHMISSPIRWKSTIDPMILAEIPTDCPQAAPHRATLRQARRVVDLRHALLAAALAQHDARGAEVRQNVALRFHHLWISRGDHPKFWKNVALYILIYCNWRTKTKENLEV